MCMHMCMCMHMLPLYYPPSSEDSIYRVPTTVLTLGFSRDKIAIILSYLWLQTDYKATEAEA